MIKRLAAVIAILVVALAALTELVVPGVITRGVETALTSTFGSAEEHDVKLKSFPAARMLLGQFDEVSVISTNVATATLVLDEVAVTLKDVSLDMKALLADKHLNVNRGRQGLVTIAIGERSLQDYLAANVPAFKEPRVLINPDSVLISGYFTVAGRDFVCTFSGKFSLADVKTVKFETQGFSVDEVAVPADFLNKWLDLLGQPDLSLDLSKFPLPLKGTEVIQEDGRVIVKASLDQGG